MEKLTQNMKMGSMSDWPVVASRPNLAFKVRIVFQGDIGDFQIELAILIRA